MGSLSDKVRKFLIDAGFEFAGDRSSNLELLHYFEKEYGLTVMTLLENEWLNEQMERDVSHGFFTEVREYIDEDHLDGFDRDVRAMGGINTGARAA